MAIRDLITQLRSLLDGRSEPEYVDRQIVLALFRDAHASIVRKQRGEYVRQVVDQHYLSHRELGALLGRPSSGAIAAAMEGKIRHEQFELIRSTVARQVKKPPRWPTPAEFANLAMMSVIATLSQAEPVAVGWEEYECLERFLRLDWMLGVVGEPVAAIEREVDRKLKEIHDSCESTRVDGLTSLLNVLASFGEMYLKCKALIPGQES